MPVNVEGSRAYLAQGQRTLATKPILTRSAVVLAENFSIRAFFTSSALSGVMESRVAREATDSPLVSPTRTLYSRSVRLAPGGPFPLILQSAGIRCFSLLLPQVTQGDLQPLVC